MAVVQAHSSTEVLWMRFSHSAIRALRRRAVLAALEGGGASSRRLEVERALRREPTDAPLSPSAEEDALEQRPEEGASTASSATDSDSARRLGCDRASARDRLSSSSRCRISRISRWIFSSAATTRRGARRSSAGAALLQVAATSAGSVLKEWDTGGGVGEVVEGEAAGGKRSTIGALGCTRMGRVVTPLMEGPLKVEGRALPREAMNFSMKPLGPRGGGEVRLWGEERLVVDRLLVSRREEGRVELEREVKGLEEVELLLLLEFGRLTGG